VRHVQGPASCIGADLRDADASRALIVCGCSPDSATNGYARFTNCSKENQVMAQPPRANSHKLVGISVPLFWPMTAAAQLVEQGVELYAKNLKFLAEEEKLDHGLKPRLATANRVMLDLRTMVFRDYSAAGATGVPTIVNAPYAGHTAMIADYHAG
jgi:hypothetical protein